MREVIYIVPQANGLRARRSRNSSEFGVSCALQTTNLTVPGQERFLCRTTRPATPKLAIPQWPPPTGWKYKKPGLRGGMENPRRAVHQGARRVNNPVHEADPAAMRNILLANRVEDFRDDVIGIDDDEEHLPPPQPFRFSAELIKEANLHRDNLRDAVNLAATPVAEDGGANRDRLREEVVEPIIEVMRNVTHAEPEAIEVGKQYFTGNVEAVVLRIENEACGPVPLQTTEQKTEWKLINAIVGLTGHRNNDRSKRMLPCEQAELNYAARVGTNNPDRIVKKSFTVTNTQLQQPRHNQEQGREVQVRENKQANVVLGNLRNRAATYAAAIEQDYRRLTAFLSTASSNPVAF